MFNSLLVELGYFETVTVGFLIIGHTHASIDQYFGCLRGLIGNASFIASPVALQHLFSMPSKNKDSSYRSPILQIQIHFVHDYVNFFEPYWNKKIINYGTPYQFKFFSVCGKAVCQYKQFSDPHLKWLPVLPADITRVNNTIDLSKHGSVHIFRDNFTLHSKAGLEVLMEHLNIKDKNETLLHHDVVLDNSRGNFLDKAQEFRNALPVLLKGISLKAMHEQELRREDEENGINDVKRYDNIELDGHLLVQKQLQMMSTSKESG